MTKRGAFAVSAAMGLLVVSSCAGPPTATPEPTSILPAPTVGGQVQFSTGCNDIVDVSILPQDKKIEECDRIINSRATDLAKLGLAVEDCAVVGVAAKDCQPALGTELVCTYTCSDGAD